MLRNLRHALFLFPFVLLVGCQSLPQQNTGLTATVFGSVGEDAVSLPNSAKPRRRGFLFSYPLHAYY